MKVLWALMGALMALALSCSAPVVERNNRGRVRPPAQGDFAPMRKKVALLPFFNESPYGGEDLGIVATEELRRELARTGEFIADYQASSLFGPSKEIYAGAGGKLVQMANKAKRAGVHFVIFGRIKEARIREKSDEIGIVRKTKSFTENEIELKMFDVHSQREVFHQTLKGYADDNTYRFFMSTTEDRLKFRQNLLRYGVRVTMRKAIPRLLKVASKLEWVGRVAKIIGGRIYVNAGRQSGLNIGDILKVMTEGEEVYDPETGALIGVSQGEVKGTLEIVEYFGPDGAIAILHSGGSVVEGDYVMLY